MWFLIKILFMPYQLFHMTNLIFSRHPNVLSGDF